MIRTICNEIDSGANTSHFVFGSFPELQSLLGSIIEGDTLAKLGEKQEILARYPGFLKTDIKGPNGDLFKTDVVNIQFIKEQLGFLYEEKQCKTLFTKSSEDGQIKYDYNKKRLNEIITLNNDICLFVLLWLHRFYWYEFTGIKA